MDLSNARQAGYNHLVSYSYVIDYEGKDHRVNFIGANRSLGDKKMKDFRDLNPNKDDWNVQFANMNI